MEQRIYGRELTDAVLGERYLPPVETFPSVENFDYEAKYQAGGARRSARRSDGGTGEGRG